MPQKKEKPKKANATQKRRVVLLDAHAILHRAYHALPEFTDTGGEPTGALYGLVAMLLKAIGDLKPDYLLACFDLPGPTYRHEAYKEYKGTRAKMDDALARQINRSRDVFAAFAIPIYERPGFEADDILGTIVEKLKHDRSIEIVIVSGDMDTMQLVDDERVRVYTLRKGIKDTILYDEKKVEERFGFKPESLPDFKGLRGDPSDNIIGIPGIGEKTATTLITEFGSIERLYTKLKKEKASVKALGMSDRVLSLLEENEEEARFSKMLAEIKRDVPLSFSLPEKPWRESLSLPSVLALFRELRFRTLSERVIQLFGRNSGTEMPVKGQDTQQRLYGLEGASVTPALAPISGREFKEAAIALWLLDSNTTNPTLEDILHVGNSESFEVAKKNILAEVKKNNIVRVYQEIELPLIPVVERMEQRGILVDERRLGVLSREYHRDLEKLEKQIWKEAGLEFNINSPKQLGDVLFDTLGLAAKNQKRTPTGARSTRESELAKLAEDNPIVGRILEYRELQKLLSTYIDTIPHMLDEGKRLHATFLQTGTTTGRMSSNNPNLQNIPIKTERGKAIRTAFIATPGHTLAAFDYSQIELRVAAFLSHDKKFIEIFRRGEDVHTAVAAQVFGVAPEQVDYEMRRRAKVINFGILYGMGINALRQNLGTDRAEAQRFYEEYFKNFSGLAGYLENTKREARRNGYTETFFGRRRYFEGIKSSLPHLRAMAERMATNAPIQGTEADIIKIAMARIDAYLSREGLDTKAFLLLQVHDELVYEIETTLLKRVAPKVQEIMETVLTPEETSGVPITVKYSHGNNWGEME